MVHRYCKQRRTHRRVVAPVHAVLRSLACSAHLCRCAVDVRLRKKREERAGNVTYSAGRAVSGRDETVRCSAIQWAARVS